MNKINCNRVLGLLILVVSCLATAKGQENTNIEAKLEGIYGWACYHSTNGGWYSIKTNEKKGACDTRGNEIIPPKYEAVYFDGNGYQVTYNNKVGYIDKKGQQIIPFVYDDVRGYQLWKYQCAEVKQGDKWGLVNTKGTLIIPCSYDEIQVSQFKECQCVKVKQGDKWGLLNSEGVLIIPCHYDNIAVFDYNNKDREYIKVENNGKAGLVTKQGKQVVPCLYKEIHAFEKGAKYFPVSIGDNKWGIISRNNEVILNFKYSSTRVQNNTCAVVSVGGSIPLTGFMLEGGKYGVYNPTTQKWICQPQYDKIWGETEGLIAVNIGGKQTSNNQTYKSEFTGGKWGFIDTQGKIVIPIEYDQVESFTDGVAQVTKKGVTSLLTNPLSGTTLTLANGQGNYIDTNIPTSSTLNKELFVIIVANENYKNNKSSYSYNDGRTFKTYCEKRLGVPAKNIRLYEDATFGNFATIKKQVQDIADVYDGEASFIFYYSGLGFCEETNKEKFLLPVDASFSSIEKTGVRLSSVLNIFQSTNNKHSLLIIDAPFSGTDKEGNKLIANRGVMMKAKPILPKGNTMLFSASEDLALADKQHSHGLFTLKVLEQLQKNKNISLENLSKSVINEVKKASFATFNKVQTPIFTTSPTLKEKCNEIIL